MFLQSYIAPHQKVRIPTMGSHRRESWVSLIGIGFFWMAMPFALAQQDEHAHGSAAAEPGGPPAAIKDLSAIRTTHGLKMAVALPMNGEVSLTLDGMLDEVAWQEATVNMRFLQRDPQQGAPSSEQTEFRVLFDQKNLYIGVVCYDSQPDGILATERQRDGRMPNDDTIAILLDIQQPPSPPPAAWHQCNVAATVPLHLGAPIALSQYP